MHTILFFFKRCFIFIADCVLVPLQWLLEMWSNPNKGRALLFAFPAFVMGLLVFVTLLWAWLGNGVGVVQAYEKAAKQANGDLYRARDAGDQERMQEHSQRAQIYWAKLLELDPDNYDYKYELLQLAAASGNMQGASTLLLSLAPNDRPVHAKSHILRAELFLRSAQQAEAIQLLDRAQNQLDLALRVEPDNHEAKIRMADILFHKRLYDRSLQIYEEYRHQYPVFIFNIIKIFNAQGRFEEAKPYIEDAIKDYAKMIESNPDNFAILERYVRCHALLERHAEAEEILNQKLRSVKDAEKLKNVEIILSGLYVQWSAKIMREIRDPETGEFEGDAQLDQSLQLLRDAFRLNSSSDQVRQQLTHFGSLGVPQSTEARELYDPRANPESASVAELIIASSYELMKGDKELGIELLEVGLDKDPNNHLIANNLAYVLREKDPQRALKLANVALKIQPNNARYLDTRGHVYVAQREYAKAVADLKKAERFMGNNVDLWRSLAYSYQQLGLYKDAELYIKKIEAHEGGTPLQEPSAEEPGTNNN